MTSRFLALAATLLLGVAGAYTVKKGDTLYSIATAHRLTVDELKRLNNLSGNTISVGQVLRVSPSDLAKPGAVTPIITPRPGTTNTALPAQPLPPPLSAGELAPTPAGTRIEGVDISVPDRLIMGQSFIMRLSGPKAGEVTVSFPSEVGEDVRQPNEVLKPVGAAGEYRILGRVVLGKTTPVVYEVKLGDQMVRGRIPVGNLNQAIQHLNLPPRISNVLKDPGRTAEEKTVENAYALRTPQQWVKPFSPALNSKAVSSSFGQPRTYVAGGPVAYHYGLDYPAPVGTPVLAVNDGTVVIAGKYPVRGNLVAIDHGAGLLSLYFHQSRVLVKVGDKVVRGQKIGLVGSTGLSAGPHLHLELRVRGEGMNPQDWISRLWPR